MEETLQPKEKEKPLPLVKYVSQADSQQPKKSVQIVTYVPWQPSATEFSVFLWQQRLTTVLKVACSVFWYLLFLSPRMLAAWLMSVMFVTGIYLAKHPALFGELLSAVLLAIPKYLYNVIYSWMASFYLEAAPKPAITLQEAFIEIAAISAVVVICGTVGFLLISWKVRMGMGGLPGI